MALSLYVDTARWRAHQKSVIDQFPGLVPVCKGNGYGFGHERLADETIRFGSDTLAVGTTYEAARIKDWFSGDLLVLTPFRRGESPYRCRTASSGPSPPSTGCTPWWAPGSSSSA